MQKSVTVQEGLCVFVPCYFSNSWSAWHPSAELYMYWYDARSNNLVATNNPKRVVSVEKKGRFRLLGDPMTKNCSLGIRDARKSDTGNYYFRVERGSDVKHNYMDKMLSLKVTGRAEAQERTWDVGPRVRTGTRHWNS